MDGRIPGTKPIKSCALPCLFRHLAEESPLPMVAVEGASHRVRYANPSFCHLAGKTSEEMIDRPFAECMPEGKENGCNPLLDRVLTTGEPESLSEQEHAQSGSGYPPGDVYWSYSAWAVRDEERRPVGVMLQVTDTSETVRYRRQVAAMLDVQETRERERAYVLSAARCMLYYADVKQSECPDQLYWYCHFIDEAAAQAFMPLAILPGERYEQARYRARHPEDRDRCDAYGTRMIHSGQNYTQEFRNFRADGSICWVREDVQVETVLPDSSWRVVCVCTDITQMKSHERELSLMNEQLVLAGVRQHELRNVAEGMNVRLQRSIKETHHRVKNNLQVVVALAEMQADDETSPQYNAALHRIASHVRTLADLHDLLTQRVQVNFEDDAIPTKVMLERLILLLQPTFGERRIQYEVAPMMLPMNQSAALSLLVSELVSNALKHGEGDVTVILERRERDARLTVSDQGRGFPSDFDVLKSANTGMELIMSMGSHDLRGDVEFTNRDEGGACVVVTFPIAA